MKLRIVALFAGVVALIVPIVAGCSTVGPVNAQTREGQDTSNSPLNKVTMVDDAGTTTAEVAGPTTWINAKPNGVQAHSTGQVTGTIALQTPDGANATIHSGNDIIAEGVDIDPVSKRIKVAKFSTSASKPLDANARISATYETRVIALSADQRAVLETMSNNQRAVLEKLAPELMGAITKAIGIP